MNIFSHHKIIENQNGVEIILYINPNEEFSEELGKANHKTETIENQAQKYVKSRFSNMKVNAIKIMSGAILLTTLSIATMEDHAVEAASNGDNTIVQVSYTVKPGDTLSEIAAKNGTTINAIKSTNNLTSDFLRVGQALTVPTSDAAINPYTGAKEETPKTIKYTVKSGDTLSEIAAKNGTTVNAIKSTNNLTSDFLRVGQALTVPTSEAAINPYTGAKEETPKTIKYTVKSGDTLSEIAAKNGTTVNAIKSTNNLTSDFLRVGQALTVPTSEAAINPYTGVKEETPKTIHYTVKSGDTLLQIAKDYNTTVSAIQQSSGLSGDFIRVGQALIIPSNQVKDQTHQKQQVEYSEEDLEWLSKIIHSEARGESLDGQIAVAAVILNRVNSNLFPNSVKEVIFEQNNGRYQFTPAGSGSIYTATPTDTNILAAKRALSGEDPTNGSLYFYNPKLTEDQWIRSRTVSTVIGNHVFAL